MKPQVTKRDFLDWYFEDADDFKTFGQNMVNQLKEIGSATTNVEQVFKDCPYIPQHILTNWQDFEDGEEFDPKDVELTEIGNWTVEKKDEIEKILIEKWKQFGMDIPENFELIVQDCYEDVCETPHPENWHDGDVAIAFRRWIENQTK